MFQARPIRSFSEFINAHKLVHDQYCKSDLMVPKESGLRVYLRDLLPTSTTFVVVEDGEVIGTKSANLLGESDIPCSYLYPDIISDLCKRGHIIAETTKYACVSTTSSLERGIGKISCVGTELDRWLFYWCAAHKVSMWVVVVHPLFEDLFVNNMGFSRLGPLRSCPHVNDKPGVLLGLPVLDILQRKVTATPEVDKFFLKRPIPADQCKNGYVLTEENVELLLRLEQYGQDELETLGFLAPYYPKAVGRLMRGEAPTFEQIKALNDQFSLHESHSLTELTNLISKKDEIFSS